MSASTVDRWASERDPLSGIERRDGTEDVRTTKVEWFSRTWPQGSVGQIGESREDCRSTSGKGVRNCPCSAERSTDAHFDQVSQ